MYLADSDVSKVTWFQETMASMLILPVSYNHKELVRLFQVPGCITARTVYFASPFKCSALLISKKVEMAA